MIEITDIRTKRFSDIDEIFMSSPAHVHGSNMEILNFTLINHMFSSYTQFLSNTQLVSSTVSKWIEFHFQFWVSRVTRQVDAATPAAWREKLVGASRRKNSLTRHGNAVNENFSV